MVKPQVAQIDHRTSREPQGWSSDPFGRFDERYFSQGVPTSLVRNGSAESHDSTRSTDPELAPAPATTLSPPAPQPVPEAYPTWPRREHRVLAPVIGAMSVLAPVVAYEMLVPTTASRAFGMASLAAIALLLTVILRLHTAGGARVLTGS